MSQYQQQPYVQPPQQPPAPKKRGWPKFVAIGCGSLLALAIIIGIAVAASSGSGSPQASSSTPIAGATQTEVATIATAEAQLTASAYPPATQAPTTPTPAPKWTTTHTFTGNGSKHTATFTAPDDWKILWKCDPASFQGIAYNVIIEVDNAADGSMLNLPVNTTCKAGNTTDSSEEHQGGSVYLNVTSEGDWTIQVQELR